MPSTCRHQCDGGCRWSPLPPKAPHFFKIIHSAILENRKLGIPKRFVRKYGSNLSNFMFLKVPGGAIWRVELLKRDGEIWLDSGWHEFAEYYSIGFGHFLVFRYEGHSHFHVLIFDKSATEIEYPFNATHGKETNLNAEFKVPKMEETENDACVEILDDFPFSNKRKEKALLQNRRPLKMTRTNSTCKVENTPSLVPHSRSMGINKTNGGLKLTSNDCSGGMVTTQRHVPYVVSDKCLATSNKRVGALERAKGFKSGNPFFMVAMQPYYVDTGYLLSIPIKFVKKYFSKKHNNVILRVLDGTTWSLKYSLTASYARLFSGWGAFVQDNCLRVGDVCVFELINGLENVLKVVIFQVDDYTSDETAMSSPKDQFRSKKFQPLQGGIKVPAKECRGGKAAIRGRMQFMAPEKCLVTAKERVGAFERAKGFKSNNPFFMVTMQPSYIHRKYKLNIPLDFVKKYFNKKHTNIILRVSDGKIWSVKCYLGPSYVHLSSGWRAFMQSNCLRVGDVCVFELIKEIENMLKVVIFRVVDDCTSGETDMSSSKDQFRSKEFHPLQGKSREAASKFVSKHPFFQVVMTQYNLHNTNMVFIPQSFVKGFIKKGQRSVTLSVSHRLWPVKLFRRANGRTRLTEGMHAFVKDNTLQVGDVCVFEMIKRTDFVLKVSIFRCSG